MSATPARIVARHALLTSRMLSSKTNSAAGAGAAFSTSTAAQARGAIVRTPAPLNLYRRSISTTCSHRAWSAPSWLSNALPNRPSQQLQHSGSDELLADSAPSTSFAGQQVPPTASESLPVVEAAPVQANVEAAPSSVVAESATAPPADSAAAPPVTDAPSPVAEAAPDHHTILGYDGQTIIDTGSLDLTSLVGSWGLHPIMRLQSMFFKLHQDFPFLEQGIKWAILVPAVTLALRSVLFYFQIKAQKNAAKMAIVQPKLLGFMNKIKAAKASNDIQGQQIAQMEMQTMMRQEGVNPLKSLVFPLAQGIVFASVFFALRGIGSSGIESLTTEGFGWVQNLAATDPYWILPITSTALTLLALEYGIDSATQVQTSAMKTMKGVFRISLVLFLPFMAKFPALVLLYWSTNNFVSLVQALTLKRPEVRSFFGIPKTPRKPQPGEPGYVKEPSFMEAFKDVQVSAGDRASNWQKEGRELQTLSERMKKAREAASAAANGGASRTTRRFEPGQGVDPKAQEIIDGARRSLDQQGGGAAGDRPLTAKEERVLRARERRQRTQQQ